VCKMVCQTVVQFEGAAVRFGKCSVKLWYSLNEQLQGV